MTTYTIGEWETTHGEWEDDIHETVRIYLEGGTAITIGNDMPSVWADFLTAVTNGMVVRYPVPYPREAYDWDDVNEEWAVNQTIFTPWLRDQLRMYREEKMLVPVSYNNGIETFTDTLSQETLTALNLIAEGVTVKNNPSRFIDYDGSEDWATMTVEDAQGFFKAMFAHQQKCFSVNRAVWGNHQITPYTLWDDAKEDFDTAMEA